MTTETLMLHHGNAPAYTLHTGDALQVLRTLPSESVHVCVTSPPYYGLRDYGTATWDGGDPDCQHSTGDQVTRTVKRGTSYEGVHSSGVRPGSDNSQCRKCGARRVDQQIGLEDTPEAYVSRLVDVFREVRRVLHKTGVVFINLGDSYAGSGGAGGDYSQGGLKQGQPPYKSKFRLGNDMGGLKAKDLMMIPARVAIALQADGWWLRQEIVWAKKSPMPESVQDRCTRAHEMVYMLAKSATYYYDATAIAERSNESSGWARQRANGENTWKYNDTEERIAQTGQRIESSTLGHLGTRNKRSVWTLGPESYAGSHFATMPTKLVEPCILAGSSAHGCCSKCGAPWQRVVEREPGTFDPGESAKKRALAMGHSANGPTSRRGVYPGASVTTGWQPTCTCNADVIPCTALDPFVGSGTTLAVALKHGRSAIGIDLNASYIDLAHDRIGRTQPLLLDIT